MEDIDRCKGEKKLRVDTVRGAPYLIAGRELTPIARVLSFGKARGTVSLTGVSGWGTGFAWVAPLGFVEEIEGSKHHIPVTDITGQALLAMAMVGLLLTVWLSAIRWLARRWRRNRS
jgi:hypothetical protein